MPIVTLTTDFGWQDHYLAMIKGAMLCEHPQLNIIDITHGIQNYDIVQAAFLFRNAWPSFPIGTIHLISVNDYYDAETRFLATGVQGHYFIAPDNGLFSLIFDEMPQLIYELEYPSNSTFPLREAYGQAVGHLAHGKPLLEIGLPAQNVQQRITLQPVISNSQIRGSVAYIDNFENVITNVPKSLFGQVGAERKFSLYFKRNAPICQLSRHYHDVPVGDPLCLFNAAGQLEIAINMGKASSLLGLKVDDNIQIDFHS
ncbi:MAG: SAM-dependent chlorinase/fluorinase [Phaeodactylibacter sp.]|nr:SAM-dependent chlorinase/fluorinase [Phaeodactylibacter sp.]MCB9276462.1 SAM-dependent chlorinase/fluorinase [Lewinellaceae bacterium]